MLWDTALACIFVSKMLVKRNVLKIVTIVNLYRMNSIISENIIVTVYRMTICFKVQILLL